MIINYAIIGAGGALVLLLLAFKLFTFKKDKLSPVLNVEAQNVMGPLVMGKLIDNKVDKSDVTSLIFFWASKGYIEIRLSETEENSQGTELIRLNRYLPENAPQYQKIMYERLFSGGETVKIRDLTNKFYDTVDSVIKEVNAENSRLYSGKSMALAVLFTFIGALFVALTPIVTALKSSLHKLIFTPMFMVIPVFVIFSLTQTVRYNRVKLKKGKQALYYIAIILLAAAFSSAYVFLLPSYYIEVITKILLCAFGFTIAILSAFIIRRTGTYTEKLNHIVGFREFILNVDKNKLEAMLIGNPEFYYQVLPFAQVLGVSDIWESKFAELSVAPPSWLITPIADGDFDFEAANSAIRSVNAGLTSALLSRPVSQIL